ncbi:uncharacterized protein LOC115231142, partial [Octopus sinensis]|uniref:Uncharacterized protein LOC115231142 n=1 Tax=Octopus sinensis TaxID=2607531 RepID=A0A7E6EJS2_9MOLL
MSLSTCSGNKLFKAKLLYTRSIMIQSMDKFWDEPYMKILLFFPIYDFKYSEHITIGKTFKCFHEVFSDPFDTQKTIRISDNSLIPPLTSDEKFMKEVRYEIKHNNAHWKDREIDPDDIASVLFQDVRFLKGFQFLVNDFEKYIFKCLDETHRMIFVEN